MLLRTTIGIVLGLAACHGTSSDTSPDAASGDATATDATAIDAPILPPPATCPTSGAGALTPTGASCFVFTPAAAGADPSGANATVNDYALAPTGGGGGHLVVFFNPSLGSPAHAIADPANNIYTAATAAGDHVLAISYASEQVIGAKCSTDACFLATRMTILTGAYQTGAIANLAGIVPSAGIYARVATALRYLSEADPQGGWGPYLASIGDVDAHPDRAVAWSKVIALGHSQGGGMAALLGREQTLARFVSLSSPCDEVASAPSGWEHADATWHTSPAASGYGFSSATTVTGTTVSGDTVCPLHVAIWDALGIPTSHRFDDAAQCTGENAHVAPTQCTANMARVQLLVTM